MAPADPPLEEMLGALADGTGDYELLYQGWKPDRAGRFFLRFTMMDGPGNGPGTIGVRAASASAAARAGLLAYHAARAAHPRFRPSRRHPTLFAPGQTP